MKDEFEKIIVTSISRLSVSNDLKYDAQRDLCDIGAQFIEVHPLNKVKTTGKKHVI